MHRALPSLALLGALALVPLGGCSDEPQVEVATFVGARHAKADPQRRKEDAAKVARAVLSEIATTLGEDPESAQEAEASAPRIAAHPPETPEELEGLVGAIRRGPITELAGPAHRIAAAGPAVWPQVRALMLADRKAPKGDYRSLLAVIGGDVPNRYGHFNLAWKKAHGHKVKLSTDWFGDLLTLPRRKVSAMLRDVYRDCVLQTALLRAAAGAGQDPRLSGDVIEALLDAAYMQAGTFRDEVGRALERVGDEAIPPLIRASQPPPGRRKDDDPRVRRAAYAELALDRMDRLHPRRATAAVVGDPRLLADVLDAYGDVRVGEAAEVLVGLLDAPTPGVRRSARAALMQYVTGPPPKARRRTIRLLGGGTGRARAYLTYRQRAGLAIAERLAEAAPELMEPPCEEPPEGRTLRPAQIEACQQRPHRHVVAYLEWLDAHRAAQRTAKVKAALAHADPPARVAALDRLLASDPELPERDRFVPVYRDAAVAALEREDHARAAQLLRKAAVLADDPGAAQRMRVTALLAEASVDGLDPSGRAMLVDTAASLAPRDPQVEAAVLRVQRPQSEGPPAPWRAVGLGFGGGLLGLGLLGLVFAPLRRRAFGGRRATAAPEDS